MTWGTGWILIPKWNIFDQISIISCFGSANWDYSNFSQRLFWLLHNYSYTKITSRLLFPLSIRLLQFSDYSTQTITEYGDYIHAQLLSFIDYSETTPIISFWKQVPFLNYPQTAPLLRFIPYYSYFQVNKTTQSQNTKATPTLLIIFKHSKANWQLPLSDYLETSILKLQRQ